MPCPGSEREKGRPQTPRDAEVHSGLDVDSLQVWRQAAVAYATGSDPGRGLADLFLGCQGGGDSGLDRRVSLGWTVCTAMVRYAMEVREDWAPWAFIKKDLKRTIASLELLGTLLCVKLWGARMKESGRGSGHLTGGTDNQGNSYAVSKLMSTKFPLPLLLMELSETLRKEEQCLDLSWIPREKNQWADDLTNQKFDLFCMSRRLILDGAQIDWIVLDSLLKSAAEFHAELVTAKRKEQTSGYQRSKKKQRTKW